MPSLPQPTQLDLNFSLFGIPIRVHPMFWLICLMLGPTTEPQGALIWVVAVFFSILIHELGHALVAQAFGWPPAIILYSFGGMAIYRPTHRDPRREILITLAGPGAGFVFAVLLCGVLTAMQHPVSFHTKHGFPWFFWSIMDEQEMPPILVQLIKDLLYINIFWGLVNLLPMLPLDGGRLCHELLNLFRVPRALEIALQVSIVIAIALAAFALTNQWYLAALFLGYLAYTNYLSMMALRSGGGSMGRWN